ncbi:GtrA family protein [Paenibacillus radicis (ex Xue et al. 2023)]|uniref:GtrA family protein n=1 Tax=Paenibacillus radicis (ex Xue et al. 2023) TaxID=2972489 RepID=A0ABT1YJY6_9BACL|nr:GtrA family protein [Paenibacillus radicis (ex Xue et al. 2023)]MCR8632578.1 GtrA family protein [Paenibacillus radicis (ex Xue et al. 2023)]
MRILMLKYGAVGLLGTVLHFAVLYVLVEAFHVYPIIASALGFIVVLIVSYFLNKMWTFRTSPSGWRPLIKYTVVSVTGLLANTSIIYISVDVLHWHYLIGQCLVVVVVPILNFVFNYYWTFQQKSETHSS